MPHPPLFPVTTTQHIGQRLRETSHPTRQGAQRAALCALLARFALEDATLTRAEYARLVASGACSAADRAWIGPRFLAWAAQAGRGAEAHTVWEDQR